MSPAPSTPGAGLPTSMIVPALPARLDHIQEQGRWFEARAKGRTSDAIRSGVYWGHAGALKEVIAQICRQQEELRSVGFQPTPQRLKAAATKPTADSPWLLLTGGGAPFLASVFPTVPQVPSLALHGLVLAAWRHFIEPPTTPAAS